MRSKCSLPHWNLAAKQQQKAEPQYAANAGSRTGKVCYNCGLEGHYSRLCGYPYGTLKNAQGADAHCLICSRSAAEPNKAHSTTACPHRPKLPWRRPGDAAPKRYSHVYRSNDVQPVAKEPFFKVAKDWATTAQRDKAGQRMAPVEPPPEILSFYLDFKVCAEAAKLELAQAMAPEADGLVNAATCTLSVSEFVWLAQIRDFSDVPAEIKQELPWLERALEKAQFMTHTDPAGGGHNPLYHHLRTRQDAGFLTQFIDVIAHAGESIRDQFSAWCSWCRVAGHASAECANKQRLTALAKQQAWSWEFGQIKYLFQQGRASKKGRGQPGQDQQRTPQQPQR